MNALLTVLTVLGRLVRRLAGAVRARLGWVLRRREEPNRPRPRP